MTFDDVSASRMARAGIVTGLLAGGLYFARVLVDLPTFLSRPFWIFIGPLICVAFLGVHAFLSSRGPSATLVVATAFGVVAGALRLVFSAVQSSNLFYIRRYMAGAATKSAGPLFARATFSGVLSMVEGQNDVDQRSLPRFAGWVLCAIVAALLGCDGVDTAATSVPRWQAREVLRIGSVDGPDALTPVFDLDVTSEGEILVVQSQVGTILRFGPGGDLVGSIGRKGQGPGEFRRPGKIGLLRDTLWVIEFGQLHLFDVADGTFLTRLAFRVPLEGATSGETVFPGPMLTDGTLLGLVVDLAPVRDRGVGVQPLVTVSRDGSEVDTLAFVSTARQWLTIEFSNGRSARGLHPYPDHPIWKNAEDGLGVLVVGRRVTGPTAGSEYRITEIGLDGDTVFTRLVPFEGVPIDEDWKADFFAGLAARYTRFGATPGAVEEDLRDEVDLPGIHTPVTELVPGKDGTIWIRREPELDSVTWNVLTPDGAPLATVLLPSDFTVFRAERGRAWGLATDALDVPYVVVYEVGGQAP